MIDHLAKKYFQFNFNAYVFFQNLAAVKVVADRSEKTLKKVSSVQRKMGRDLKSVLAIVRRNDRLARQQR